MLPDEELTASCGAVTVVATAGADRFLARCTCGCLHLVWDNASISLLEADLQHLLDNPPQDDQAVAKQFEMRSDPFGGVQLWAGSGGLRVPAGDWRGLMSLLELGAAQVMAKPNTAGAVRLAKAPSVTCSAIDLPN